MSVDKKKGKRIRLGWVEVNRMCKRYWKECGKCITVQEGNKIKNSDDKKEDEK